MRILLVNNCYSPNVPGGTERSVQILAEGLVRRGHGATVLTTDSLGGLEESSSNGVKVVRYRVDGYKHPILFPERTRLEWVRQKAMEEASVSNLWAFSSLCRDGGFDIVHTNNISSFSPLVWRASSRFGLPVVHTIRDYWLMDPRTVRGASGRILSTLHSCWVRPHTKGVAVVTAPSKYVLSRHLEAGFFSGSEAVCVPNAIEREGECVLGSVARKGTRIDPVVRFVYVGNLTEAKGLRVLLDAMALLSGVPLKLSVCGDGPLRGECELRAEGDPRITVMGRLGRERLEAEYEAADVLVVPSVWEEPFGRVLIEGFSHGLPVVAARSGGIPEIVLSTGCGVLCEPGSAASLASAMADMTDRRLIASFMGKMGAACERYSVGAQIDSFLSIYRMAVGEDR